jgi:hypothetical protein
MRLALLTALLAVGCGGQAGEGLGLETAGIAGGEPDASHTAVFQEYTNWPGEDRTSACTATLIAQNLMLTARHCIAWGNDDVVMCGSTLFEGEVAPRSTIFTNAAVPGSGSLFHFGADIRVPVEGDDMCGFDVALVILERPVPASEARPTIPRIDRHVEAGEPYVAVGYGENEFGEPTNGRMQRGGLAVLCATGSCGSRAVAPTEFMGEEGVCSGDSGGPALDADGKVIGVVSRGASPCERPIYGSVASWSDWITETALDAASVGGYDPPFWALTGSSDPPMGVVPEGESCSSSGECVEGLACYYATDPGDARCTRICESVDDCDSGLSCSKGFFEDGRGLCLVPSGPAPASSPPPDEGCSVSSRSTRGASPSAVLLFLVALALVPRRRLAPR